MRSPQFRVFCVTVCVTSHSSQKKKASTVPIHLYYRGLKSGQAYSHITNGKTNAHEIKHDLLMNYPAYCGMPHKFDLKENQGA